MIDKKALETIAWQNDGNGFVQYKTNDFKALGARLYQDVPSSYQSGPGGTVTVNIQKLSGDVTAPYGLLFGYQDSSNFYRLLVSAEKGSYRIDKKVNGVYTEIRDWRYDSQILWGLQSGTTVQSMSITQPSSTYYTLKFNNSPYVNDSFYDSSLPTSGWAGYYFVVGDSLSENFPLDSEDMRFQMTAPVVAP
jgi:hypothetical protein